MQRRLTSQVPQRGSQSANSEAYDITIATPVNAKEAMIWDMQKYSDTLFSGSFSGKLKDLRITENVEGVITIVDLGENDLGSGNIYELEMFNSALYMGMCNELYKATNIEIDIGLLLMVSRI